MSAPPLIVLLHKVELLESETTQLKEALAAEKCRRRDAETSKEELRCEVVRLLTKLHFPSHSHTQLRS